MPKSLRFTFVSLLFLLVFLGAAGFAVAHTYSNCFYPGTQIANLDISGLTYSQAQADLLQRTATYSALPVTVIVPDPSQLADPKTGDYPTKKATSTVAELGVVFLNNQALDAAWQPTHQHSRLWPLRAMHAFTHGTSLGVLFSQTPQAVINFVTLKVNPLVHPPVPATLAVAGDTVSLLPAQVGVAVNTAELVERLRSALRTASDGDVLTLQAPTQLSQATVTEAILQPLARKLNALGDISLALTGSGTFLSPSRAQQLAWYSTFQTASGDVRLTVDEAKVSAYLRGTPQVNLTDSSSAITKALNAQIAAPVVALTLTTALAINQRTVSPVVQPGQVSLGLYPGKYIQVNLAEQKLYRIIGSNLEKVYRISTGKSSTPTPTGTFTLNGHARRPLSSLYGLYMPYWINFKDGAYGMHELPEWPNGYKEGEGHLGVPVSDGCIRLGVGEAKEVYDWTPDGTPLLIQ